MPQTQLRLRDFSLGPMHLVGQHWSHAGAFSGSLGETAGDLAGLMSPAKPVFPASKASLSLCAGLCASMCLANQLQHAACSWRGHDA